MVADDRIFKLLLQTTSKHLWQTGPSGT